MELMTAPIPITFLPIFKKGSELEFFVRLQRHTLDLFSKTPNLFFYYVTDDCTNYKQVESVRRARFPSDVKVEHLEEFIRNHQELQYLTLDKQVTGEILPTSNINDIKSIWILEPSLNFDTFLLNFRGENVALFTPVGYESHIENMIENWLNGRYSENLRVVYIASKERFFPDSGLLDEFECMEWNEDETPPIYKCDEVMQYQFSLDPEAFDCREAAFIRRELDGKMASVRYEPHYFVFYVWE
ncbi:unnamed protein product [Caenorhabditis brenneri]